jgi:hypothetical protein
MRGRVGPVEYAEGSTGERALIALGAGFNPILTGALASGPSTLDSASPSMAPCSGSLKRNRSARAARRTEGLGMLMEEQPKVGLKGAASWTMQVNGCRRQAWRASRLGRSANQIDKKIDEIIDFAEIREFIDMPVMNYSSGMSSRLSFAVATAMNPDVLVWMRFKPHPVRYPISTLFCLSRFLLHQRSRSPY